MGFLTAKQFSEKWEISERRIIKLCKENRINGAVKNGMVWLIPEDTIKPSDKRSKISKYINTQRRIMIVNINNEIGYSLIPILTKQGYIVDAMYTGKNIDKEKLETMNIWNISYKNKEVLEKVLIESEKYYDGLIIIDLKRLNNEELENKKYFIKEFSKKMNCESSIVLINSLENTEEKLEKKLSEELKKHIGLRINSIDITSNIKANILINYKEIAEDAMDLLVNFKNTTGMSIKTDGGCLEFDFNGRTKNLEIGIFYKFINRYFNSLNKNSYMWSASTMLEDEWTEEPAEMNFRVINLEAANRGANLERIFIFSKSKIKEFKNNKTLKIYMQSNINTMFVDYDEISKKEPELLKIVGSGWDGIDTNTLIVDLPEGSKERGYISINKDEVQNAYNCFQRLKTYAKDLKEILK